MSEFKMQPKAVLLATIAGLRAHLDECEKCIKDEEYSAFRVPLDYDRENQCYLQRTETAKDGVSYRFDAWNTYSSTTHSVENNDVMYLIPDILRAFASGAQLRVVEEMGEKQ